MSLRESTARVDRAASAQRAQVLAGEIRRSRRRAWQAGVTLVVTLSSCGAWWALRDDLKPSVVAPGLRSARPDHVSAAPALTSDDSSAQLSARLRVILGTVKTPRGASVAGATVCEIRHAPECCSLANCVLADVEGRFRLDGVGSEVAMLHASAAGYLPRTVALAAAGNGNLLSVTLEPGGAEIAGEVVDAQGGPVAQAFVSVRSLDTTDPPALAESDGSGKFRLNVAIGEVEVLARAEAYSRASARVHAPVQGLSLILGPSAAIVGRVVSADTEAPVVNATVTAAAVGANTDPANASTTDAAGEFRIAGLAGGSYEVSVGDSRWRSAREIVVVGAGQASEAVLLRARTATSLTAVVRVGAAPCKRAELALDNSVLSVAAASVDGTLRVDGLVPGEYRLTLSCLGATSRIETLIVNDQPLSREWTLERGSTVTGRVERLSGEPVPNVPVSVVPAGEAPEQVGTTCRTDAAGEFVCSGLAPGQYVCLVSGQIDPSSDPVSVALSARSDARALLKMRAAGTLRVAIDRTSAAPRPLRVFARAASLQLLQGRADGEQFVFDQIPLGEYQVYADLPTTESMVIARLQRDGQVIEVALPVAETRSIAGRAVDEQGAPVVDAWVRAALDLDADHSLHIQAAPALTDGSGHFTVTGLAGGTYSLQVTTALGSGEASLVSAGTTDALIRVLTRTPVGAALEAESAAPAAP